jgi:hypothetical protein
MRDMLRRTLAGTFLCALSVGAFPALAASAGGLSWTAPAAWKEDAQRPMRAATYKIPAAPGDGEDAELAIFYFGPGQGGGVQENVKRWIGQISQPDGKPSDAVAKTQEKKVGAGLKATFIDVSGTYLGMGGPMAGGKAEKTGYRLLGAIVEGPEGAVFFKLTGPAKTVKATQKAFDAFVGGIKKG